MFKYWSRMYNCSFPRRRVLGIDFPSGSHCFFFRTGVRIVSSVPPKSPLGGNHLLNGTVCALEPDLFPTVSKGGGIKKIII